MIFSTRESNNVELSTVGGYVIIFCYAWSRIDTMKYSTYIKNGAELSSQKNVRWLERAHIVKKWNIISKNPSPQFARIPHWGIAHFVFAMRILMDVTMNMK